MKPCNNGIADAVVHTLEQYFHDLDGEEPVPIYDMVLKCAEKPMLKFALERAGGNQSTAAKLLGINRNTLRRKLIEHSLF